MGGEQNSSLSIIDLAQMWFRASYHNMQLGLETRFVKKIAKTIEAYLSSTEPRITISGVDLIHSETGPHTF